MEADRHWCLSIEDERQIGRYDSCVMREADRHTHMTEHREADRHTHMTDDRAI